MKESYDSSIPSSHASPPAAPADSVPTPSLSSCPTPSSPTSSLSSPTNEAANAPSATPATLKVETKGKELGESQPTSLQAANSSSSQVKEPAKVSKKVVKEPTEKNSADKSKALSKPSERVLSKRPSKNNTSVTALKKLYRDKYKASAILEGITAYLSSESIELSTQIANWAASATAASMESIYAHGDPGAMHRPKRGRRKRGKESESEEEEEEEEEELPPRKEPMKRGKRRVDPENSAGDESEPSKEERKKAKGRPSKQPKEEKKEKKTPVRKRCREVDGLALDPHFMSSLRETPRLKVETKKEKKGSSEKECVRERERKKERERDRDR